MLKAKNIDLINSFDLLKDLNGKRGSVLGYRTARAIGTRVIKAAAERLQEYETLRVALVKHLGEEYEPGKFKVRDDKMSEFTAELTVLQNEEVELVNVDKLKAAEFENAALTGMEWLALEWLIED